MRYQLVVLASIASLTLAAGCGGEDPCSGHTHDPVCLQCDQADHDPVTVGAVKEGNAGSLKIEIVESTPAPHQEGNNNMVVKVVDAADQPMTGVAFDKVETFYPPGGHGTPVVPVVVEAGNGEYSITEINYVHEGVWTLTIDLTAGSITDTVAYEVCVVDPNPGE